MLPVHPGEIRVEDFLKPTRISQYRLANSTGVSQRHIEEIISGNRAITTVSRPLLWNGRPKLDEPANAL